jgi:phospholipid/cholesterol/gamma-HCH transport system substrate-binding protein
MDVDYSKKEKIVGVFTLVVLFFLLTTMVFVGRGKNWFRKYVVYYTTFNESYNLQENAAVKMFKTDIGRVEDISLDEDRVRVRLGILEEYAGRIREGSLVSVESPTLIGDEYVSIKPGVRRNRAIPSEGEIDSVEKKSLAQIMDEFEVEKTSRMFIKALQDFSEIIQELRNPEGPFFATLHSTRRTVENLEAGRGTLGSLMTSRELIENTLTRLDQMGSILEDLNRATAQAPETMARVNRNLAAFETIGNETAMGISEVRNAVGKVEENIDQLKRILADVEKGSPDIPRITRSARQGIHEIRDGVKRIDRVFQSVEGNLLIRSNLPERPRVDSMDADLR